MTQLLDLMLPRTLDQLVERATRLRPTRIEAWLFEDEGPRRQAEKRLAAQGIRARLHSAYKPLLHAFLEEPSLQRPGPVTLTVSAAAPHRLKADAYPLAGLRGKDPVKFITSADLPASRVIVQRADHREELFVPLRADLSPTAWLRWWRDDRLEEDGPLPSDYQAAFEAVMQAIRAHHWPTAEPHFDQLVVDIATGGIERPIPWDDEVISTREGLHEDLYFSILEYFQHRAGRPSGDRTLQPGQIIPRVVAGDGPTRVRVSLTTAASGPAMSTGLPPLARLQRPLHPDEVAGVLACLPGERFGCRSAQGRLVGGIHWSGAQPGVVITAGQHANESCGVVGALRAAQALQSQPDAHFALVPMENPDGAALFHTLRGLNPRHMNHAARFTALGDDLEARNGPDLGEKAAREDAIARTGAQLHFSLHGYPAHEWTRPFSGYLPPRSTDWTLPKGFFLIMRHHPGRDPTAFLQHLTAALIQDPALRAFNERQHRMWQVHWGDLPFRLLNGILCWVYEDCRSQVPFTLISEYPDETTYGSAFQLGHETQTRTVLLGSQLYWQGLLSPD